MDQEIIVAERSYWFCAKCICRKTGTKGFYNTTHPTSRHQNGVRVNPSNGHTTAISSTSNSSGTPPNSTTDGNQANLSSLNKKSKPSSEKTVTFSESTQVPSNSTNTNPNETSQIEEDEDPNQFSFTGAFMSTDDGTWVASIDDAKEDTSVLEEPLPPPVLRPDTASIHNPSNPQRNDNMIDTAVMRLAMSSVANQMDADGFAVDTIINADAEIRNSHELEEPSVASGIQVQVYLDQYLLQIFKIMRNLSLCHP